MKILQTSFACVLACSAALHAAILTVDNNPGSVAMYKTFEAAYADAVDGDTILLAGSPNHYGTSIQIYKNLTIIGPGHHLFQNEIPGASNFLSSTAEIYLSLKNDDDIGSASGTKVVGIEGGVYVERGVSNITVEKCYLHGMVTEAPDLPWEDTFGQAIVNKCFMVYATLGGPGSVVSNSILNSLILYAGTSADHCVINHGFSGNHTHTKPSSQISNSIFGADQLVANPNVNGGLPIFSGDISNCISLSDDVVLPSGNGNINSDLENEDVFVWNDSPDGKYQLKPGSIAIGAGTGGSDIGAFGGANPYKLSGVPAIPRLTHLTVPPTATSESGLRFEVEAQAFGE